MICIPSLGSDPICHVTTEDKRLVFIIWQEVYLDEADCGVRGEVKSNVSHFISVLFHGQSNRAPVKFPLGDVCIFSSY